MRRRLYYRSGMKAAVIGLYRGRRTVSWKLINSAYFIHILEKWSDCSKMSLFFFSIHGKGRSLGFRATKN